MSAGRGSDVQRAIDFLSDPRLREVDPATLPHRPDYEALAQSACALGHDLPPGAIQEAFRLMMRARLLARR
jgi:hypothetical protein